MFRVVKNVVVELNTANGCVFSVQAAAVELRASEATIAINPDSESYFNMSEASQISMRVGTEFLSFALKNAAAKLQDGRLTIMAEEAVRVAEAPEPRVRARRPRAARLKSAQHKN
jgi:F0F1-type ATP synthase epsilon subunit